VISRDELYYRHGLEDHNPLGRHRSSHHNRRVGLNTFQGEVEVNFRVRCDGCGNVIGTLKFERGGKDHLEIGVMTPRSFARKVPECPFCGRELSKEPIEIIIRLREGAMGARIRSYAFYYIVGKVRRRFGG